MTTNETEAKVEEPVVVEEKLNSAQQLAKALGLPYKAVQGQRIPATRYRHRTFRSSIELAVKKKSHARRVGRPK